MNSTHKRMRTLTSLLDLRVVLKRVYALFTRPVFWLLTIWGNLFVVGAAAVMHFLERNQSGPASDFLNCLIWAVGLVTTAGASEIQPVTVGGKILMIIVMIGGAVFLWTYMALFISALIDPELQVLEAEMREMHPKKNEAVVKKPS